MDAKIRKIWLKTVTLPIDLIVFSDMDYLPKDPAILVSSVNMLLKDEEFDSMQA